MPPEQNRQTNAQDGATPPRFAVQPLETFKTDIAEAIEREKLSAVKIAAAQSSWARKKNALEPIGIPEREGGGWQKPLVIIISILLFIGGIGLAVYFIYFAPKSRATTEVPISGSNPVDALAFDGEKLLVLPTDRAQALIVLSNDRRTGTQPLSTITAVRIATSSTNALAISKDAFMTYMAPHAPASLIRALGQSYAFGFHMLTQKEPIIVISVASYDFAYAGMLSWESDMPNDLADIFYTKHSLPQNPSGTPTIKATFSDSVIVNKDVRVWHDPNSSATILYSFPDKKTLVITTNETTMKNLYTRIRNAELTR